MTGRNDSKIQKYIESLYKGSLKSKETHHMQISPHEGMILGVILKAIDAKNVLEIGTLYGYSTACIQKYLSSDAKIITIEKSPESYKKAKKFLSNFENIECINADAVSFLKEHKPKNLYDAVFIDADKSNYINYLNLTFPFLRKGGLVIVDNTLMFGEVINENSKKFRKNTLDSIRKFNSFIASSEKFDSVIIPTNSGLTVGIKNKN